MRTRMAKRPAVVAVVALAALFGNLIPAVGVVRAADEGPRQPLSAALGATVAGAHVAAAATPGTAQSAGAGPLNASTVHDRVIQGPGAVLALNPTSTPTPSRLSGGARLPLDPPILLTAVIQPGAPGQGPSPMATPTPSPTVQPTQTLTPTRQPSATPTPRPTPPAPTGSQCGGNGGAGGTGGAGAGTGNGGTGGAGGAGGDCTIIINEVTQVTQVSQPIVGGPPVIVERPVYVDRPVVVEQPAPVVSAPVAATPQDTAAIVANDGPPAASLPPVATDALPADGAAVVAEPARVVAPSGVMDSVAAASSADAVVRCPAPFGLAEPVQFPAMIDGTLVLSAPLCQVFGTEPVDACATSYYFYEPDREYYCYLAS